MRKLIGSSINQRSFASHCMPIGPLRALLLLLFRRLSSLPTQSPFAIPTDLDRPLPLVRIMSSERLLCLLMQVCPGRQVTFFIPPVVGLFFFLLYHHHHHSHRSLIVFSWEKRRRLLKYIISTHLPGEGGPKVSLYQPAASSHLLFQPKWQSLSRYLNKRTQLDDCLVRSIRSC